ncbi:hypothetical protein ACFVTJ_25315, partial [Agrobacterium sp. NPDC058088]|uniref:hypothetical protein n=1 Tax=Agrobacterium sp. NPDC058088 TaxID=3346335 RepID=UPI0036DE02E8
ALKIFAEIRFAHDTLPASKLGKKASTNLGAIQSAVVKPAPFKGLERRIVRWPRVHTYELSALAYWLGRRAEWLWQFRLNRRTCCRPRQINGNT